MWSVELLKTLVLAPAAVCPLLVARACGGGSGWVVWLALVCASVSAASEIALHRKAGARGWQGAAVTGVLWGSAALALSTAQHVSMKRVNFGAASLFFVMQLMSDALRLNSGFTCHRVLLLALELLACAALGLSAVLGASECELAGCGAVAVLLGRVSASSVGGEAGESRESRSVVVVKAKMAVPDARDFLAV